MTPRCPHRATPALAAALALACGGTAGGAAPASPAPEASPRLSAAPSAAAEARADSLRRPYTEADVRFMSDMIRHHAQAIEMAGWAPTHGASPAVQTLAARIANGQRDEIVTMERWLRDRGRVPDGRHGHMHMPGMLTEAQLRRLDGARGAEFDRLFLTFMIQHHRGAVCMVEELFGTRAAARDETVFKFANDVNVDQSTEIARMETMLADLDSERHSP